MRCVTGQLLWARYCTGMLWPFGTHPALPRPSWYHQAASVKGSEQRWQMTTGDYSFLQEAWIVRDLRGGRGGWERQQNGFDENEKKMKKVRVLCQNGVQ